MRITPMVGTINVLERGHRLLNPRLTQNLFLNQLLLKLEEENLNFYNRNILPLHENIFVFSSDIEGRHACGDAKTAKDRFNARYVTGQGRTGNAYAIPTRDIDFKSRTLNEIKTSVNRFLDYAQSLPKLNFFIARDVCNVSELKDKDIVILFIKASKNCHFHEDWQRFFVTE